MIIKILYTDNFVVFAFCYLNFIWKYITLRNIRRHRRDLAGLQANSIMVLILAAQYIKVF